MSSIRGKLAQRKQILLVTFDIYQKFQPSQCIVVEGNYFRPNLKINSLYLYELYLYIFNCSFIVG